MGQMTFSGDLDKGREQAKLTSRVKRSIAGGHKEHLQKSTSVQGLISKSRKARVTSAVRGGSHRKPHSSLCHHPDLEVIHPCAPGLCGTDCRLPADGD